MTLAHALALVAAFFVMVGLLFLSMIHLFMIPREVIQRDTDPRTNKKKAPRPDDEPHGPEIEKDPPDEPELERDPGQRNDPEPEVERIDSDPKPMTAS